ncbi:MAG: family 2 glycosyl transferase [Pseudomonadota bacterium]
MTRIAVAVCSAGRPDALAAIIPSFAHQTRPADRVLVVVTRLDDLPWTTPPPGVEARIADKGLALQRNTALEMVMDDCDIVVFFDDDFIPSQHALAGVENVFATMPEVSGLTGIVLADGAVGPGISFVNAQRMVQEHDASIGDTPPAWQVKVRNIAGLYGCNMAYRLSAIRDLRFDEVLPLYGWQEDIDFSARVPGVLIRTNAMVGVHCGAKNGRETAGHRLGYSQIANPLYLWNKGTLSTRFAARLMLRNMAANHLRALRPEPWIDRLGRARGNWIAIADAVKGRIDPRRILNL